MIISMLLLGALLPHLTLTGYANVGIINGTEAKSRPYMVSVQKNGKHICGGFLVSEQFVMTAAHCFENGDKLMVVVGAHELNRNSPRIAVKFYHIHPGYDSAELLNDIMILQLNKATKNIKNVKLIPIPIPEKDKDIKAKTKCSVAGWGAQKTYGPVSKHLMEVDVTIVDNKECRKKWDEQTTSKMVCANGKGGFCQGDSGGPLVCNGIAVGVVSFNEKNNCDKPIVPNVYTRISKFLTWINAILKGVKKDFDY